MWQMQSDINYLHYEIKRLQDKVSDLHLLIGEVVDLISEKTPVVTVSSFDLPALNDAFLHFHDNGRPAPRGRTTYGLVLDVDQSKHRWNINFEICTMEHYVALLDDETVTPGEKRVVQNSIDVFSSLLLSPFQTPYLTYAKRNRNPGQKGYKLECDFSVCAILIMEKNLAPHVMLFYGDQVIDLKPSSWRVPNSNNASLKWMTYL